MKKIISILICVLIAFSFTTVASSAEEAVLPIDAHYSAKGNSEVKTVSFNSSNSAIEKFNIFYPAEVETKNQAFPMIIFCNGTGMKSSNYKSFIEHLASWGYIVVGNNAGSTGTGETTLKTLDFMLELNNNAKSVFLDKIDKDKIALIGHSQGGSSTINSASIGKFEKSEMFKTIVSVNGPRADIAAGPFQKTPYDASLVKVPAFLIGGVDTADAGSKPGDGICPLDLGLKANMNSIDNDNVVIGQIKNSNHDTALDLGRGYIVAWFEYILLGNSFAAGAFEGLDGEIYQNVNWQNTMHKTSGAMGEQVDQYIEKPKENFIEKIKKAINKVIAKIKKFFNKIFK